MDTFFSKREKRLLINLLKNNQKIISRDLVAQAIWGSEYDNSYTDWALDQFIRRLRNKLSSLGFAKTLIKTVKNRGFTISSYGP